MRALIISIVGVIAAAAVVLFTLGVPVNFLIGRLQSHVEVETGYRLRIDGGVTMGFWPSPTAFVRDVSILGTDGNNRLFATASARLAFSLTELLRGRAHITKLTLSHPTVWVALDHTPRRSAPVESRAADAGAKGSLLIDHIVVEDGVIDLSNGVDRMQGTIEHINLDASLAPSDGTPSVTGTLSWGGQLLQFGLKSPPWPPEMKGQTVPVQLALQAPGLLVQSLSASAELRVRDSALTLNAIAGRVGDNSFDGSVTLDISDPKPSLRGKLNFDRLQILPAKTHGDHSAAAPSNPHNALTEPWSDREFQLDGLNFFTADVELSANELDIGSFRFAPIAATATLKRGLLQIKFGHTGLYGGTVNGTMSLDASAKIPVQAIQIRLNDVSALPLLSDVADFQSLEGTLQANIDVTSAGVSQRRALSSLDGAVDVHLSKGAVRGIDLAKIMHDLTSTILDGWQQNPDDKTPLTELSAHFRLKSGVATTDDLTLSGPVVRMTGVGNIDIAAKKLSLKVDPHLIVADKGSGDSSDTTGLGVPVNIDGDWSAPRIYPDVDGILNNPDSVFKQLQSAGKGLFGGSVGSGSGGTLNNFFQGLGNILGAPPATPSGSSGSKQ